MGRACYIVSRDGQVITPDCLVVHGQKTNFTDTDADVFKDYAYRVSLYPYASGSVTDTSGVPMLASDVLYVSPDPNLSSIPTRIVSDSESENDLTFTKVKDFGDSYLIDDTLVRYAVRMKSADGGAIEQNNSGAFVHIDYGSGELLFVSDGWDKILDAPRVLTGSIDEGNYRATLSVEVGDQNAPMVLGDFVQLIIENIWSKPARVTSTHAGVRREIPECVTGETTIKECYRYDVNKVIITTKKFSSFTIWNTIPRVSSGGGGGSVLRPDICPSGDYSASYYDGSCGAVPPRVLATSSSGGALSLSQTSSSDTMVNTSSGSLTKTTSSGTLVKSSLKKTSKTLTKKIKTKTIKAGDILERGKDYIIRKGGKKNIRKMK